MYIIYLCKLGEDRKKVESKPLVNLRGIESLLWQYRVSKSCTVKHPDFVTEAKYIPWRQLFGKKLGKLGREEKGGPKEQ